MTMWTEMLEQSAAVAALIEKNQDAIASISRLGTGCTHAVIAARGTSDNAGRYAQSVWGSRNRLVTGPTLPSLFGVYKKPPSLDGALVIGISQSGQSPDLVEVMVEARRQGRPTIGITNHPDSPLADQSDVVVELSAGVEVAVAATKTYTAQLAAIACISHGLAGEEPTEVKAIPPYLKEVLEGPKISNEIIAPLVDAKTCVVIGRGFHMASAYEWSLKLQELAQIVAQPFSVAAFLHGPIAAVDPSVPALVVVAEGPTYEGVKAVSERLLKSGVTVIAMTDNPSFPASFRIPIPKVPEWLSPLVAAPALQMFAHATAIARGHDPESPRGLSKVTLTH